MNRSNIKIDLATPLAGRSIYWLAKTSGVPYSTVHKIARNRTDGISFVVLEKLSIALGTDPHSLFVVGRAKRD